ncbi:MAG: hypothetical protein V2A70_09540 [Candidatus Omnitrophota bacterium]
MRIPGADVYGNTFGVWRDSHPGLSEPQGKYGDSSRAYLVSSLLNMDVHLNHYEARIFGGGAVVGCRWTGAGIGETNIALAKQALGKFGMPTVASDVGGKHGQKAGGYLCGGQGAFVFAAGAAGSASGIYSGAQDDRHNKSVGVGHVMNVFIVR